jgi:hypothetical protein
VEFVGFFFIEHLYMLQKTHKTTKEVSMVTRDDWVCVCQNVKDQCTSIAKGLIAKLDKWFLAQDLMNAKVSYTFNIGYNQKLFQCSLVICKSWKCIIAMLRSCNQMVFAIILCWMLFC